MEYFGIEIYDGKPFSDIDIDETLGLEEQWPPLSQDVAWIQYGFNGYDFSIDVGWYHILDGKRTNHFRIEVIEGSKTEGARFFRAVAYTIAELREQMQQAVNLVHGFKTLTHAEILSCEIPEPVYSSEIKSKEFGDYWELTYSQSPPISYNLKSAYPQRWFRIHNLPESKRYAETQEDWDILLQRQNTLITDLLGEGMPFTFLTGYYRDHYDFQHWAFSNENPVLGEMEFISLSAVEMEIIDPGNENIYHPILSEQIWQADRFNEILKDIANDGIRAIFVGKAQQCLIAPYDGGIDIILKDEKTRDAFKKKYKNWLSARPDGL